jgi:hypothetical protein
VRLRDVRLSALKPTRKTTPVLIATALIAGAASPFIATSAASAATTENYSDTAAAVQAGSIQSVMQRPIDKDAAFYANVARGTMQQADALKVDTTSLGIQIAQLDQSQTLPEVTVDAFVAQLRGTTSEVQTHVVDAEAKRAQEVIAKAKAEAKAKAKAAAEAKAAAQKAKQLAVTNTVAGAKAAAQSIMSSQYGWGSGQFSCLNSLWTKESGWNYRAYNANGGATGIPQALPGSKMAAMGSDWASNATTQIKWGLWYINATYGSPCSAWSHSQAMNWY